MQGQPNLNCKQMEEALDAFYDLELSPEEAQAVEQHLADCEGCTTKLAEIDALVTQLKNLPAVAWSGDLSDAIEARILAQAGSPVIQVVSGVQIAPVEAKDLTANKSDIAPSKVVSFFKPRYILASAASILALCLAFNQFGSSTKSSTNFGTNNVNKMAQAPVINVTPQEKNVEASRDLNQKLPAVAVPVLASTNVNASAHKKTENTSSSDTLEVASKPVLTSPSKSAKEETTTERMLASKEPTESDHNKNNVADSEEIVAAYDYENIDSASDFGINTNEDGLYAIKL